jgi:hypothetical protein
MTTLIYLLKASACTGLFYTFYFLFLRRLTFFTLNRWYLLVTLLLSFFIPQLHMPVEAPQAYVIKPVLQIQQMQRLEEVSFYINNSAVQSPGVAWFEVIKVLYLIGALLLLLQLIVALVIFFSKLNRKKVAQFGIVTVLRGIKALEIVRF